MRFEYGIAPEQLTTGMDFAERASKGNNKTGRTQEIQRDWLEEVLRACIALLALGDDKIHIVFAMLIQVRWVD